jgi:hypothetical protein
LDSDIDKGLENNAYLIQERRAKYGENKLPPRVPLTWWDIVKDSFGD